MFMGIWPVKIAVKLLKSAVQGKLDDSGDSYAGDRVPCPVPKPWLHFCSRGSPYRSNPRGVLGDGSIHYPRSAHQANCHVRSGPHP